MSCLRLQQVSMNIILVVEVAHSEIGTEVAKVQRRYLSDIGYITHLT